MGLFDIFSGQIPASCEYKGDQNFKNKDYGSAKLEYEKALELMTKKSNFHPAYHRDRIQNKLDKSREGLALQHKETAENLIEVRSLSDAEELLILAAQLTQNNDLIQKIEDLQSIIQSEKMNYVEDIEPDYQPQDENFEEQSEEEYFVILVSALPEDQMEAYFNYGETFKKGYVALNQMEIESAVELLSQAKKEQGDQITYVHLELATAILNQGDFETSASLLEQFLEFDPESIRAYEMMCDILWEKQDYAGALNTLTHASEQIKSTIPMNLLLGETLVLAGKLAEAESLYLEYIRLNGWNTYIATALAGIYEKMGHGENALDLYGRVIKECQGCGKSIDPFIKQRFAELSYKAGHYSENLNELYLSLCQDDPDNRGMYYERISDIYSKIGHHDEAERFRLFSEKMKREN